MSFFLDFVNSFFQSKKKKEKEKLKGHFGLLITLNAWWSVIVHFIAKNSDSTVMKNSQAKEITSQFSGSPHMYVY